MLGGQAGTFEVEGARLERFYHHLFMADLDMIDLLGQCEQEIQERMLDHFARCDPDYGRRVADGLGRPAPAGQQAIPAPAG